MFFVGCIVGILIMILIIGIVFVRLERGFLIVDFSLSSEQPFLLELTTNVNEVYNSKFVLLRTIRR
jgi:hypothetical protein